MRENMDEMLTRVREYVFQTDEALKESQRNICRDGTAQHETAALRQIREDIWQLEDKVRAAKWASSPTEQAELANQIDPLMLRVLEKCQKHRDQVQGCQGLLTDIVTWCERGTSAYRFAVHESAVTKAPSRYSSGGGSDPGVQGKVPSRIPAYKSPTKQPKAQSQQQQAQAAQQQQLLQVKATSRIPQPVVAARKSLPDAEQQGSSPDQLVLQGERSRRSSSSNGGTMTDSASSVQAAAGDSSKVPAVGPLTSNAARIAALQRGAAATAAAPAPAPARAPAPAAASRTGGLVAAAAAAFEGSKPATKPMHCRVSSSGGSAPAAAPAPAAPAPSAALVESFVPLDLDSEDGQLLQPTAQQPQAEQQQQEAMAMQQERLSRSGSSSGSLARGSGGRSSRSLLQLEPSRDDVALSSAGQLLQQPASVQAAAEAPAEAPAATAPAGQAPALSAPSAAAGAAYTSSMRVSGGLHGADMQSRALQLRVARPSNTSDASTADFNCSLNDFSEFGPLRSFTPMVSQNGGRSNPFAAGGSSSGYVDRSSLRTSQDISMLLRSGMLMEAALLSSNASRMHVIHDAVAKKPPKPEGKPEVPVVPSRLAVHKKRPWWAQAARVVVGTAAMAAAGAAGAAAAKHTQGDGEGEGLPGMLRPRSGSRNCSRGSGSKQRQQPLALEEASTILPFAPLGPAPDASAGCG